MAKETEIITSSFPTGKPHVSFSEVKTWTECSYRHKLQHVDKINLDKPGVPLVFGTAVHDACEEFLKTKKMDPNIAIHSLEEGWKSVGEGNEDFTPVALANAKRDAVLILNEIPKFMDETFLNWEFHTAEEQLYESIEGHDDVKFKGFIDGVLTCTGKRGEKLHWIIDWKTSSRGWHAEQKQDEMKKAQVVLYKNFWQLKNPGLSSDKDLRCGFIILKKIAKPGERCEFFPVSAGPITVNKSLKVLNNMITSVKKGIALKNRESCRYCVYKDTQYCT